jgi:hypothetical protein
MSEHDPAKLEKTVEFVQGVGIANQYILAELASRWLVRQQRPRDIIRSMHASVSKRFDGVRADLGASEPPWAGHARQAVDDFFSMLDQSFSKGGSARDATK